MKNDYISSPHTGHGSRAPDDELRLDHPPRGIRMERAFDGTTVIRVRMFSSSAFGLLGVALFWNGLTSIFVCFAIALTAQKFGWNLPAFSFFTEGEWDGSPPPLWFLWLFLSPFIAIGLGMICMTVFQFFGRCVIHLDADEGRVFTGIGPFGRTQRFSPQSIKSADVKQSIISTKRTTITTNLVIEMNNGREIKFPGLGKMRETWLTFALGKLLRRA